MPGTAIWTSGVAVGLVAVVASLLAIGLACAFAHQRTALRKMAHELRSRPAGSGMRVTVGSRSRGILDLARAINETLDNEEALRERDAKARLQFNDDLASLSHDIRTPLAGAQGYLDLYNEESDPERRKRCLACARERLVVIRGLVDDLFEYAKVLSPGDVPRLVRVNLFTAVTKAFLEQFPAFSARGWEPRVDFADEDLLVAAPAGYLERICANLTTNVLRHGSSAPTVVQRGTVLSYRNRVANPHRIDPNRLFDRFYCADGARSGGGSGLGLAIVAQLCRTMGVSVTAHIDGIDLVIELDFANAAVNMR